MGQTASVKGAGQASVCVGRQAILDRDSEVVAYELLYRGDRTASGEPVDGMAATAQVLVNTVANLGIESVVGKQTMYINCTLEVLALPLDELLPPEQVVLEVLESVEVSGELAQRLEELRALGFRVALDDWVLGDPRLEISDLADIIKVDVFERSRTEVQMVLAELHGFTGIRLAEKVETEQQFRECSELGFDLFQGFYFCRPTVLSQKTQSPEAVNLLRVLSELQRSDITVDEAALVVEQDVAMSYKLLRCLNSASVGLRKSVDSVRHGLVLLGVPRVRAWVTIMGICSMTSHKPVELMRLSLIRSGLCSRMAEQCKGVDSDTMTMVGMFSLLDVLLDMPMSEILAHLPLSAEVSGMLLDKPSQGTSILQAVKAYEVGDFAKCHALGFDSGVMGQEWLKAVARADELVEMMLSIS